MSAPDVERGAAPPLRLDRNEGPRPPRELVEALRDLDGDGLRRYPDPDAATGAVERLLAERLEVDPRRVVLTAGGDGAIDLFFARFGAPGARCVVATPTFGPIVAAARRTRMELFELDGLARRYPVAEAGAALRSPADRLVLVSPNNPTGFALSGAELDALLGVAAGRPTLVDLAYGDYADEDLAPRALGGPGACVLFSLSKAWGLAGLRVGFLVVPAELAAATRATRPPYPVATAALAVAERALSEFPELAARNARGAAATRDELVRLLLAAGLECLPSRANFVLARGRGARAFAAALAAEGVLVRRFDDDPALADAVRVTCPTDADELRRLRAAVDAVCRARAAALAGGGAP